MKKINSQKNPYEHTAGIILAGGASSRYGKNKAFLEFDGIPLIEHIAEKMKGIFQEVILVANEKERFAHLGLPVVEDFKRGLGPLGGIYTGLLAISNEAGFFVACDMPFIDEGLIRYMTDIRDNHWAVVPSVGDEIEPLHAIYSISCLGAIKNLIDSEIYQVRRFYEKIHVRYVQEDKIRQFVSPKRAFLNINTPDEYDKFQSLLKS